MKLKPEGTDTFVYLGSKIRATDSFGYSLLGMIVSYENVNVSRGI